MKFYVGVTDNSWFDFLSKREPEEVNFWRPKNQNKFRAIGRGDLFLFKLHSPLNFIVGGGFLLKHEFLPLNLVWDTFGLNNGVPTVEVLERKILTRRTHETRHQPVGCTILVEPFFWPKSDWIPIPEDWSTNLVTGKTYDTTQSTGKVLWTNVQERLISGVGITGPKVSEDPPGDRFGQPHLVSPRLGQGAFRIAVTGAYGKRCAVTAERTLPALATSHIRPYSKLGPHQINNGMLLRSDIHNLFDSGYLTVSLDYRVEVSSRIKSEFANGRHYYALHGQKLSVIPQRDDEKPDKVQLEWHHNNCYQG